MLRVKVITPLINIIRWNEVINIIDSWGDNRESRYICICNVHSVVTAARDSEFNNIIDAADMATPDGAPVAWMLKKLSGTPQERINGPDLMWRYCEHAARTGQSVFLYGGMQSTLELLQQKLIENFPLLKIAGVYSPPFRDLTLQEDNDVVTKINNSGANVIWVSLGCPKQERWMANHRGKINGVMIGVGAAFDYHAGTIRRAPRWMQNNGLEWLHRLCSEPRRLWRRYFITNILFIFLAIKALVLRCR